MINIEPPSRNVVASKDWLLRAVVRLRGDESKTLKLSQRDLGLPEINDRKYTHRRGMNPIVGELMSIRKNSEAADWDYRQLETAIDKAIDEYERWCEENLHHEQ